MSNSPPRRIDRETANRLLDGDPDALSRAGRLAAPLRAARGQAHRLELAGEQAALAAFRAAADLASERRPPRKSMLKIALAKLLTVKAAAVAAATGLGGVALAAGTGVLPNPLFGPPATPPATHAPATHAPATPVPATPAPATPGTTPSHPDGRSGPADAAGSPSPSLVGLCQAYTAGAATNAGQALKNPAFAELVDAAGGADNVEEYCAAATQDTPDAPGRPTVNPTGHGRPTAGPAPTKRGGAPSSPDTPATKRPGEAPTANIPGGRPRAFPPRRQAPVIADRRAERSSLARPARPARRTGDAAPDRRRSGR